MKVTKLRDIKEMVNGEEVIKDSIWEVIIPIDCIDGQGNPTTRGQRIERSKNQFIKERDAARLNTASKEAIVDAINETE